MIFGLFSLAVSDIFTSCIHTCAMVSAYGHAFHHLDYTCQWRNHQLPKHALNFCLSLHIVVTRASREGSEDPGWGGHVSDRKESPGALAEEELLQWRPSLFHGDPAKCDGHLQKSNLHPSSRRRAGTVEGPGASTKARMCRLLWRRHESIHVQ